MCNPDVNLTATQVLENFSPADANPVLAGRGFPEIGKELTQENVEALMIGTPFYIVRKGRVATPMLSMMMGRTGKQIKLAQAGAGCVTFSPSQIGVAARCFSISEAAAHKIFF